MSARVIRSANFAFYWGCIALVLFACIYVPVTRTLTPLVLGSIVSSGVACCLWGLYYATLRYRVDATGITRCSLFGTKRLLWSALTACDWQETDANSIATCRLTLVTPQQTMVLSSDLLPIEAVQELAADLRTAGYLPAVEKNQ